MIASVVGPAWEKHELAKAVRVVRSSPKTVRRVFEHHARQFDKSALQPRCARHTAPRLPGTCTLIEGHVTYVPLLVPCGNRYARPNDPLPLKGSTVRTQLLKDLTNVAEKLGADLPPTSLMRPRSLWPETGAQLRKVEQYASRVSETHYVRIVDKGTGIL